jgi:hypothetical protein
MGEITFSAEVQVDEGSVERVRRAIYDSFASDGRLPADDELATLANVDRDGLTTALVQLAGMRHIALGPAGEVTMAHPFTTLNLGFSVMGRRSL